MDKFKQKMVKKCGPGGLTCTCCNPFHRKGKSKDKRKLNRIARRTLKHQDARMAENIHKALNFPERDVVCHNFAFGGA